MRKNKLIVFTIVLLLIGIGFAGWGLYDNLKSTANDYSNIKYFIAFLFVFFSYVSRMFGRIN
jgi:hypothetical protein